jgi:hypothetical protein
VPERLNGTVSKTVVAPVATVGSNPTLSARFVVPLQLTGPMDDSRIEERQQQLLAAWNRQDARGMASLFVDDANVVGYDGTSHPGR